MNNGRVQPLQVDAPVVSTGRPGQLKGDVENGLMALLTVTSLVVGGLVGIHGSVSREEVAAAVVEDSAGRWVSLDYEVQMVLFGWTAMIIAMFLIVYCILFLLVLHLSGLGSAEDDDMVERLVCKDLEACLTFAYVLFLACVVCAGFDTYNFMLVKTRQPKSHVYVWVGGIMWLVSIPLTAGWFYSKLRNARRCISIHRADKAEVIAAEASLSPLFDKDESSDR